MTKREMDLHIAQLLAKRCKSYSASEVTLAMMIARKIVKDEIKSQGLKVAFIEAKEITRAAKAMVAYDPKATLTVARREIRRREKMRP